MEGTADSVLDVLRRVKGTVDGVISEEIANVSQACVLLSWIVDNGAINTESCVSIQKGMLARAIHSEAQLASGLLSDVIDDVNEAIGPIETICRVPALAAGKGGAS